MLKRYLVCTRFPVSRHVSIFVFNSSFFTITNNVHPNKFFPLVPVTEEADFDDGLEKLNNILSTLTPDERDDLRYQIENIMAQEETSGKC